MHRFCSILLVFALCVLPVSADVLTADRVNSLYWYSAGSSQTVSSAAAVFTIQATANSKQTFLDSVTIQSSVALTGVKLEIAGTAATATAGTVVKLNSSIAASVGLYTASDVGTGTTVFTFDVQAGIPLTLDLSGMTFASGSATTRNCTIRTPTATGTIYNIFKFGQGR